MSQVDLAVERIKARADYCHTYHAYTGLSYNRLLALATLEYVTAHVSAPQYGHDKMAGDFPSGEPEDFLARESGICGHAQIAMRAILDRFGIENRACSIWSEYGGHATVEARWSRYWRYFDPTWGLCYVKDGLILGLKQVIALGPEGRRACEVAYENELWRVTAGRYPKGEYLTGFAELDVAFFVVGGPQGVGPDYPLDDSYEVLLDTRPKAAKVREEPVGDPFAGSTLLPAEADGATNR